MKCEETSSTQNNVDETEENKDFHVEKIDTSKETTERKRLHQQREKQLKKIREKKN